MNISKITVMLYIDAEETILKSDRLWHDERIGVGENMKRKRYLTLDLKRSDLSSELLAT